MFDLDKQTEYQLSFGKWAVQISPFALCWIKIHWREIMRKQKRNIRLMEFGAGVSTIWFGKHLQNEGEVFSVEGDKKWYERVKGWIMEEGLTNIHLKYTKQDANFRLPIVTVNENYIYPFDGSWDIIINDGAIRETIGNETMKRADQLIREGGVYLRHDYEKAVRGDWIQTGWERLGYDKFCAENSNYELITVSGNGGWGYKCELGGIWRKPNL